jgi:hypothetical protein
MRNTVSKFYILRIDILMTFFVNYEFRRTLFLFNNAHRMSIFKKKKKLVIFFFI